jgi:hypothetical protein
MFRHTRLAARSLATVLTLAAGLLAAPAFAEIGACAPVTIDGQAAACVTTDSQIIQQPNGDLELDVTATLNVFGQQPASLTRSVSVPLSSVDGTVSSVCRANGQVMVGETTGDGGYEYGIGVFRQAGDTTCYGILGLTISNYYTGRTVSVSPPSISVGTTQPITEPYHIPQICLVTTPGACVGPDDGVVSPTLPNPEVNPGGVDPGDPTMLCLGAQPDSNADSGYAFYLADHDLGLATQEAVYGYFDDSHCVDYVPVGIPRPNLP